MEKEFRELIEAKGQIDGLYLAVYPKRDCHISTTEEDDILNHDIIMAILDDRNRVELLCVDCDDARWRFFDYLTNFSQEIQNYIFNCFKEE